jgi:tripartite-type tricarboxylate transporter receptor subunit TctC
MAMSLRMLLRLSVGIAVGVFVSPHIATAQDAGAFYRGKTVRVIIGYGVGGGYDINARMAARHLGKYLPGHPTFVPQNMPGASGLAATGYMYGPAPKDGTVIGTVPVNLARDQVLQADSAKFDVRQLNWIGRMTSGAGTYFSWYESNVKSFADLKSREVVGAGSGPGANSVVYPPILNELMGTRIKVIKGFPGTSDAMLALQRGEVDLVLEPWQTIKSGSADLLRDKKINLIVQFTSKRHPDLPNVPAILELCETDEQRRLFTLLLSTEEIGRSLAMPPGVPADRVKAMRAAFTAMMDDPDLHKEAETQRLDLDMATGEFLEKSVMASFDTPPEVVAKLRQLLKAD